ncbi:hypothetical protein IAU60_005576 [Kwoniella sp. DSM 27419]
MSTGVSATQAAEFHTFFHAERQNFEIALGAPGGAASADVAELSKRLSALRSAVSEMTSSLPLYDRGKYEKQLLELEAKLAAVRAKDRPKTKFSFAKSTKAKSAPDRDSGVAAATPRPSKASIGPGRSDRAELAPFTVGDTGATGEAGPSAISTYHIASLRRQLVRPPAATDQITSPTGTYTLSLADLDECLIDLRPSLAAQPPIPTTSTRPPEAQPALAPRLTAIHARGLRRCVLIAPVVGGSALLHDVLGSVLVLGAQQCRIHTSTDTIVLLHVASLPVIEHSTGMRFGPYPPDLLLADDPGYASKHADVQDFDWPLGGTSPHWRAATPEEHGLLTPAVLAEISHLQGDDQAGVVKVLDSLLGR